jgi:hypothetical protein
MLVIRCWVHSSATWLRQTDWIYPLGAYIDIWVMKFGLYHVSHAIWQPFMFLATVMSSESLKDLLHYSTQFMNDKMVTHYMLYSRPHSPQEYCAAPGIYHGSCW